MIVPFYFNLRVWAFEGNQRVPLMVLGSCNKFRRQMNEAFILLGFEALLSLALSPKPLNP